MLKKFLIGTFVMVALLFATQAFAYDFGPTTLKIGSRGEYVKTLQMVVGANQDSVFGPMTEARVMVWQTANGLVADGLFGSASKATANMTTPIPPVGTCPAGSFDPMTGLPCGTVPTLPAGCTSVVGFSVITGLPCTTVVTLPDGCTSLVGYSPITGTKCDGGTTTPTPPGLTGGAGDVTFTATTADTETEIVEGATEKVLAFRAEADGSDIQLNNLKITLTNGAGTGSMRLERYIEEVAVWDGSTKVGTLSATDFTKSSNVYSKSLALSNVIVRDGSANRKTFYVSLKALSNIDTADLTADSWDLTVDNIRFTDATGVVMTSSYTQSLNNTINFVDSASASDIKVKVTKDSSSPAADNVQVSSSTTTSNVTMLVFKLKAEGTDMTFDSLKFTLNGTGATPAEAASEIALYQGSTKLGDLSTLVEGVANTIDLYDTFTINKDQTVTFKVLAKINKIGTATFLQGEGLKVGLGSLAGLLEDKASGNTIASISGTATGETQTFYSEGVNVSNFTSSATSTSDTNGLIVSQTYTISYKVTAFGNTYYVPKTAVRTATIAGTTTQGIVYSLKNSSGTTIATGTAASSSITSSATTVGSAFEIPDGEFRIFNATIAVTKADDVDITGHGVLTVPAFVRLGLATVRYDIDSALGSLQSYTPAPVQNFETADKQLQN